jgi:bifunctional non-homologous end joining protein LigD
MPADKTSDKDRIPFRVTPMLATLVRQPFHQPGWIYEEKYDGYRILAYKEGDRVTLVSRNGNDRTATYSSIARAIEQLRLRTVLLDGEVVALDRQHISRFQLLQDGSAPTAYAVFDCLYSSGRDLRGERLEMRRASAEAAIDKVKGLRLSHRLPDNGLEAYKVAKKRGYEGVVAKDLSSSYIEGRSSKWLKVKLHQEEEMVIGGFTKPEGSRHYFGALLLGAYAGGKLRYVGKVGTGFNENTLASLHRKFKPLMQSKPAFADPPQEKGVTYLQPKLVAQISFQEWTSDRKLRQPVFLGLRDDKRPEEVQLPAKGAV